MITLRIHLEILRVYLWKEWRDQRAVVLGFLAAIPLLLGICVLVLPSSIVRDPILPRVALVGSFAIALLAFAGDLIPGEARRGRLDFLRRMPADLGAVFAAKLIALVGGLALFSAYGCALACLISGQALVVGGWLDWKFGLAVLWLVPWMLAVSCWLPRGALALPATGLLLALLGLPLYLIYSTHWGLAPTETVAFLFALGVPIGAVGIAWLSFVRGYRFGRGIGAAALRGLLASVLLVAPAWAYAGYTAKEWRSLDTADPGFGIEGGIPGEGGRYLFLNGRRYIPILGRPGPVHPLIVDLKTGTARVAGEPGQRFVREGWMQFSSREAVAINAHRLVVLQIATKRADDGAVRHWNAYYDGRTGERVKSGWSHLPQPEVDALRRAGDLRLPEGCQVWASAGLGYGVFNSSKRRMEYYDPFRDRLYDKNRFPKYWFMQIRPGRWVALPKNSQQPVLLDPDTGEAEPLPITGTTVVLPGGDLLVNSKRGLERFDPRTGARNLLVAGPCVGQLVDRRSLLLVSRGGQTRYARLGPGAGDIAFLPLGSGLRVLHSREDGVLIGAEGGKVVRLAPPNYRAETLFPR